MDIGYRVHRHLCMKSRLCEEEGQITNEDTAVTKLLLNTLERQKVSSLKVESNTVRNPLLLGISFRIEEHLQTKPSRKLCSPKSLFEETPYSVTDMH